LNESHLIQRIARKDEAAFKELVEAYQHMVFNAVLHIVQDFQEAEDVAQEVFIQVYQSAAGFRGDAKLSTWLYRIAVSKALEWQRKRKAKKRVGMLKGFLGIGNHTEELPTTFHHPGVLMEQKENAALLHKAIQQLPDNQKTAFILVKAENLSYEEAAAVLQTSVAGIEGLLHRAKQNLRNILKQHYQ
jgi:RNA polymerase sigma factor (sigma-70 family)